MLGSTEFCIFSLRFFSRGGPGGPPGRGGPMMRGRGGPRGAPRGRFPPGPGKFFVCVLLFIMQYMIHELINLFFRFFWSSWWSGR